MAPPIRKQFTNQEWNIGFDNVYTVVVWWIRVITYSLISGKVKELTTQVWNIQNNVTLTFLSTLEYVSAVVN